MSVKLVALLVVVVLSYSPVASSQSNVQQCAVVADSLAKARALYSQHCSLPRKDCDPIDGQWYCSSSRISRSVKPVVVNQDTGNSNSQEHQSASLVNVTSAPGPVTSGQGPCIDTDGDGWGWNGASCRVAGNGSSAGSQNTASASNSSDNTGPCIDTDGDGWGWNGASCKVAPINASGSNNVNSADASSSSAFRPSDITDLVLLTGQSNALGANTDYVASLDSPDPQVFAFTDVGWKQADLHQIWDRGWHPRNYPDTDPSNNLLLHFGKRLVARDSGRVVGFILVSAPGAAISNWDYNGEFYRRIENRVLDAINQLPHKSRLDGILWHQGETDANDTPYYGNKLRALIRNFRSENWFSDSKPFLCGEIAKRGGVNNRLNALNNDSDPYTGCVSSLGVATRFDGSHFTAEGLREIGKRYADRYYSITR